MTDAEVRVKIEAILDTANLQADGEFIWNYDDLVEKFLKLFKKKDLINVNSK